MKSSLSAICLLLTYICAGGSYVAYREFEVLHRCSAKEVTDLVVQIFQESVERALANAHVKDQKVLEATKKVVYAFETTMVEAADPFIGKTECSATLVASFPAEVNKQTDFAKLSDVASTDPRLSDVTVTDGHAKVQVSFTAHNTTDDGRFASTLKGSSPLATLIGEMAQAGLFGKEQTQPKQSASPKTESGLSDSESSPDDGGQQPQQ